MKLLVTFIISFYSCFVISEVKKDNSDDFSFDDRPVEDIVYPDWFKQSFLELFEDLVEAKDMGKKGIIVYFGQKNCPYCKALIENNFKKKDILKYIKKNFDLIAINTWGAKEVVTLDNESMTERQFSLQQKAYFTPTLIFYDTEGKVALRLRGYHAPYKFRAALEYVVEGYYQQESFAKYLSRAKGLITYRPNMLNFKPFFMSPPYALDRTKIKGQKPLLVFFEQQECHACDVLHSNPLQLKETKKLLNKFDIVQIDILSEDPVLTPHGEKLTSKQWAEKLDLFYTPTLIFYDEGGTEIMRLDSVAGVYRLKNVLDYISSKDYIKTPAFSEWTFNRIYNIDKLPKTK